jgi:hypothetical protein
MLFNDMRVFVNSRSPEFPIWGAEAPKVSQFD